MLWSETERRFVNPGEPATRADDPCLRGLTVSPQEVIKRINKAKGKGGRLDLSGIGLVTVPAEVWTLTELQDLQLSNNRIVSIPEDVGNLVQLERLGLAGNRLRTLPAGIGKCVCLEGLWAHGNLIGSLPDTIGELGRLRNIMLAGNRLRSLPATVSELKYLEELSLPGNELVELPESIGGAAMLRVVDLHGNKLRSLPASLGALRGLEDLSVQGNELATLPDELSGLRRLRKLNVAENNLEVLPEKLGDAMMLNTVWCYNNPSLRSLPQSLVNNLSLKAVWAEGCGLEGAPLTALVDLMAAPGGKRKNGPFTLGLDASQVAAAGLKLRPAREGEDVPGAIACEHSFVAVSEIGSGIPGSSSNGSTGCAAQRRGYFKHVRWHAGRPAPLLIVAFGSAPGLPNWGGLLKKLKADIVTRGKNNAGGAGTNAAAAVATAEDGFDVLYVTDTTRSWYHGGMNLSGGDPAETEWRGAIAEVASKYQRVLHLGDSMGASAALVYADVADHAIAFCPQVDLYSASIRPGRSRGWMRRYQSALTQGVGRAMRERGTKVEIHSGTWEHDLAQAECVPAAVEAGAAERGSLRVVRHDVDNHRLALALEEGGELLPLVRAAVHEQVAAARIARGAGVPAPAEGGGGGGEERGSGGVDAISLKQFNPGIKL